MEAAGDLYSGVQVVIGNEAPIQQVQEEVDKQKGELAKFRADYELLSGLIQAERTAIADVRSYLTKNIKSGEAIQAEFRARELYLDFLTRLDNLLRDSLSAAERER